MRLPFSQRSQPGPQRPKSSEVGSTPTTGPLSWRTHEIKTGQQPQEGHTSSATSEEKTRPTDSGTSTMPTTGPIAWRAHEIKEPKPTWWDGIKERIKRAFRKEETQESIPEKPPFPEALNERLNQYYNTLAEKYPDAEKQLEGGARRLQLRVNQNTILTLVKLPNSPGIIATIQLEDHYNDEQGVEQTETETISIISLPNNVRIDSALVKNGELSQKEDDNEDPHGNKQKHNTYMHHLTLKERYKRGIGILKMVVRKALKHPESVAKFLPEKRMAPTTPRTPNQPPMVEAVQQPQARINPNLLSRYAELAAQVLPHDESFVNPARPSPQTLGDRGLPDITITVSRQRPTEQGYIIVDEHTDKRGIPRLLRIKTDAQGNILEAQARELNKNRGFEELPQKAFPILAQHFTKRIKAGIAKLSEQNPTTSQQEPITTTAA